MKRFFIIFFLFLTVFLNACAGGNSTKKMSEHTTAGMKEMTKGIAQYIQGCYPGSQESFLKAYELFSASDQLSGVAMSLNNMGNVYRITGDTDSALLFFDESFTIYSDINDYKGVVQALSNKAAALIDANRLEEAMTVIRTAENISQKNKMVFSPLLNNKGILFIKKKEYGHAEEILQNALAKADPENLLEFATVNFSLGNLMLETQRYETAIDFFDTALKADRRSGFYKGIADDLSATGLAYSLLKNNDLAVTFYKRSIKIYALIGDQEKVHEIMEQLEKDSIKTGINIGVTKRFVNEWLGGKALKSPCE